MVSQAGNQQRDCLTAEPWASESARQIPPLFAPRIAYSSFIFYFELDIPGERVSW